jgi:hypothetical protein
MHDLAGRLANRVQLTTDGHRAYRRLFLQHNILFKPSLGIGVNQVCIKAGEGIGVNSVCSSGLSDLLLLRLTGLLVALSGCDHDA